VSPVMVADVAVELVFDENVVQVVPPFELY
jgi:hypothetical protein